MAFVLLERRTAHPLLPLRVVWDRNRGGSYLALLISGAGLFAIFLFLTYFLQASLGFTPIRTGLAFLPMIAALAVTANLATTVGLPRFGPRPLVPVGMTLAAVGLALLTGIGLIIAPSMQGAVSGVSAQDAGIASATVSTMQQVGGSIGTALLSSIAAGAATDYLAGRAPSALVAAQAAVHSYVAAFWWAAAIFVAGAVITGVVLRPGRLQAAGGDAAPVHL